ncbi:hypothetical protein FP2506_11397 [Fulvimarina pelagi HTCC2506]|uniref:Uncharacterized protein n=1 Tax=Fulvimarina pelagi HTCC2506 TaxID=314231 RepID=Q0FZ00_9HYPH|nr:hypothetical protein [Fulvimarina pelagi]EAU40158.1 hypothetical protein FP2506_11397 [Fulvimarina pelagi HTCC2506]
MAKTPQTTGEPEKTGETKTPVTKAEVGEPPKTPTPGAAVPVPASGEGEAADAKSAPASEDGREVYEVTERAGPKVAGRRVKAGDTLRLTEAEARSDLLTGALIKTGGSLPKGLDPKNPAEADKGDQEAA